MDFWRVEDAVGGSVDVEDKEEASDDKYKEENGIGEMDSRAERSDGEEGGGKEDLVWNIFWVKERQVTTEIKNCRENRNETNDRQCVYTEINY